MNSGFSLSLKGASSEEITDNRKEVFDTVRRILKFISENHQNLSEAQFEQERLAVTDSLLFFALKCSEKNFKVFFEKLLKWSKLLQSYTCEDETLLV